MSLIEAIERCPEQELQGIWETDLEIVIGRLSVRIQKEAMTPSEEEKKHMVTEKLNPSVGGGFGTPGAINAILIAMVLFEPGSMRISTLSKSYLLGCCLLIGNFCSTSCSAGLRFAEHMRF